MDNPVHIYSLPNEVFVQILSPLPTQSLLPLATVSHRFHALVLRILHYRLLEAAALKEYKLILECFHPSRKLTEPQNFCKYLGTDGLSDRYEGQGSLYENLETAQKLGRLTSLYSRFRPETAVEERRGGTRLAPSDEEDGDGAAPVTRSVSLDQAEDFFQLCVFVGLVKVMPGSRLLSSPIDIVDGIIRLWRDWLKNQTLMLSDQTAREAAGVEEDIILPGGGVQTRRTVDESSTSDYRRMMWVGEHRNVGLKLRVREKKWNSNTALLVNRDDERQTSYQVEIEEIHIRTTRLLLATEKSIEEQKNQSKAIILGGYPPRTGATLMM